MEEGDVAGTADDAAAAAAEVANEALCPGELETRGLLLLPPPPLPPRAAPLRLSVNLRGMLAQLCLY